MLEGGIGYTLAHGEIKKSTIKIEEQETGRKSSPKRGNMRGGSRESGQQKIVYSLVALKFTCATAQRHLQCICFIPRAQSSIAFTYVVHVLPHMSNEYGCTPLINTIIKSKHKWGQGEFSCQALGSICTNQNGTAHSSQATGRISRVQLRLHARPWAPDLSTTCANQRDGQSLSFHLKQKHHK